MQGKGSTLKPCVQCGTPFVVSVGDANRGFSKFCSRQCVGVARRIPPVERSCERCGDVFLAKQGEVARGNARFCSVVCRASRPKPGTHQALVSRMRANTAVAESGCWEWQGRVTSRGYGDTWSGKRRVLAHRAAWEIASGSPIPPGGVVGHICDNPRCVRADEPGTYTVGGVTLPRWGHLFLGTTDDNIRDRVEKGRTATGDRNGSKTKPERRPRGSRNWNALLTDDDVREMRRLYAAGGVRQIDLAVRFGVKQTAVSSILRRQSWAHVD